MSAIVKVENLSKRYTLGGVHPGYATLREAVGGALFAPFKSRWRRQRTLTGDERDFWALRDVSFTMGAGETLGIIGRNGAGKSTLLKILCRITKPTRGRARLGGRVGSLLEVGTGFHPDLTGRENIFLNGAVLGMRRAEIKRKFDEIVAFSEVEQHLDTAVKFYSSGMYVRLAFSVAAHLDPEILIMDEVLAVGDVAFQQKCLNKMDEIHRTGRTIFFVSHNMPAVTRLCQRAILLREGRIVADGATASVISEYLKTSLAVPAEQRWNETSSAPGDEVVRLRRVRVCAASGETTGMIDTREAVGIEISYEVLRLGHALRLAIDVYNEDGVHLFRAVDAESEGGSREQRLGKRTSTAWIPSNLLAAGNLFVHVSLASLAPQSITHTHERNAVGFQVVESNAGESLLSSRAGIVRPLLRWTHAA